MAMGFKYCISNNERNMNFIKFFNSFFPKEKYEA